MKNYSTKINKEDLLSLLDGVSLLLNTDQLLYEKTKHIERFNDFRDKNGSWWLNYQLVLESVWLAYEMSEREHYKMFKTCREDAVDLPVAWYTSQYNIKGDASIPGPFDLVKKQNLTGFIPDEINTTILSKDHPAKYKIELLDIMFNDLKTLQKNHKPKPKKHKCSCGREYSSPQGVAECE